MGQIILLLDEEDIQETFEALCSLPFVKSSISECEPATQREHGIEYLLFQLSSHILHEE